MTYPCPMCHHAINDDDVECPHCDARLDPFGTIQLPRPMNQMIAKASRAASKPARAERPAPAPLPSSDYEDREPIAPRKARSRPAPPVAPALSPVAHAAPIPAPRPTPPTAVPVAPPQAPPPRVAPVAAPQAPAHSGGGLKGFFNKILNGSPAPAVAPPLAEPVPAAWSPPAPAWRPDPPAAPPAHVAEMPSRSSDVRDLPDEDEPRTRAMEGIDLGRYKAVSRTFSIQYRDKDLQWRHFASVPPNGLMLGRTASVGGDIDFPLLNTMAVRHLRLTYDGPRLVAEDLGSLNGVYLKIAEPTPLADGTRFRIGGQVLEFRENAAAVSVEAARASDGEEFNSYDLRPLAFVDLIRPNNEPGVRFPITGPDATKIGDGRKPAEILLKGVEFVSALHAQIRKAGGRFYLEDLESKNGTYVKITKPTPVKAGDTLLVGRAFLQVSDQHG